MTRSYLEVHAEQHQEIERLFEDTKRLRRQINEMQNQMDEMQYLLDLAWVNPFIKGSLRENMKVYYDKLNAKYQQTAH